MFSPAVAATPASANKLGFLYVATIGVRVTESALRSLSRLHHRRIRRAKAQPLELRLRIPFCACLFSVRFEESKSA